LTVEFTPNNPAANVNVTGMYNVNEEAKDLKAGDKISPAGENKAADMLGNMKTIESIINVEKTSTGSGTTTVETKEVVTPAVAVKTTEELHAEIFEQGFKACQSKLILIVADKTRTLTRPILIETITNLKP
jgi:hypothetical protein